MSRSLDIAVKKKVFFLQFSAPRHLWHHSLGFIKMVSNVPIKHTFRNFRKLSEFPPMIFYGYVHARGGGRSAPPRPPAPRPPGQIGLTAPDIVSCRWNKLTESLRLNAKFVLLRLCMRNCFLLLLTIPSVSTLAIWRAC